MCACRYRFVEQPSNAIMCNPYPIGRFITRCVVDFSTQEGIPLSLTWHTKEHSNSPPLLLTSDFTTVNGDSSVRSELNIALPADMAETYEGYRYFCRVNFYNGTILKESQEFYLFPQSVVTTVLDYPTCDQGSAQSTLFEECIDPNYSSAPPITITTAVAETTPQLTTSPRTTPPPTTPPPTTPPPTTPPPTTPPPTTPPPTTPPPPPPTTPPPTTSSPTTPPPPPTTPPPPPPTTTPPEIDDVSSANKALTFDEEILLYSAIGAAVVLIVVVVVLLLCLCLWNRVCRQSKYCTCCSYY